MSTAPLFVATIADLRGKLRLAGAESGSAEALIDEAVLTVRMEFFRRLTKARVDVILAMAFSETPSSTAEQMRAVANLTEVLMVRRELMDTLPVLFQDASGAAGDDWNRDAPFRNTAASDLRRQKEALTTKIEKNLVYLAGDAEEAAEPSAVQGGTIEPDETPPRPFETIYPRGIVDAVGSAASEANETWGG